MKWIGQATLTFGVILAVATQVHAQAPDDRAHARAEFDRGVQLYTQGNYQSALEAFQEAYRLAPHPTVRVNMANCYDHLNKPVEAIFHFEHYLTEAGRGAPSAQRHDVEAALERLHERVGQLTLHVSPDGAHVTIDGSEDRRAPVLEPVTLTAGTHNLETVLNGYTTDRRTVEVPGGGHNAEVSIRLERPGSHVVASGGTGNPGGGNGGGNPNVGGGNPNVGGGNPTVGGGGAIASNTGGGGTTTTTTTNNGETGTGLDNGAGTGDTGSGDTGSGGGDITPPPDDGGGGGGLRIGIAPIVIAAASGALFVGAIIAGIVSMSANSAFNTDVMTANDPAAVNHAEAIADGYNQAATASSAANWADALGITAAIGFVVAGVLVFIDNTGSHNDQQSTALTLAPSVSQHGAGLTLHGAF